jgi:TonB-dependent SusC/RagA subfamily outer membrane receptor
MKIKVIFCLFLTVVSVAGLYGQKKNKKITVTGYVVDRTQKPIANAIVMIDGENTNHVTDSKGYYKIKVKSGTSRIGIFALTNGVVEEAINGRSRINFTFESSVPDMKSEEVDPGDEPVNIGYETIKKKDLTTTVRNTARNETNYDAYHTIYDLIRGELPGVQVTGTSIKVQGGPTSFSLSSEPLLIVDDMPVNSIENITPNMVKSVHLLKGASASIYGSRGTNGVILIELIGSSGRQ